VKSSKPDKKVTDVTVTLLNLLNTERHVVPAVDALALVERILHAFKEQSVESVNLGVKSLIFS